MRLDVAANFPRGVFDLAVRLVESFPDRDQRVLAFVRVAVRLGDDDFPTLGHCDAKIDLEQSALPVMGAWSLNNGIAAGDPRAKLFQPFHLSVDLRSNLVRRLVVAEDDLGWRLHGMTLSWH
jgi:hypothetical protein